MIPNRIHILRKMEATFSKKKLDRAREIWAALDKNKDNIWQYEEFPHPDWKRANRDGDDGLSWKEELTDKTYRIQAKTYPKKYDSSKRNGLISKTGIKIALTANHFSFSLTGIMTGRSLLPNTRFFTCR